MLNLLNIQARNSFRRIANPFRFINTHRLEFDWKSLFPRSATILINRKFLATRAAFGIGKVSQHVYRIFEFIVVYYATRINYYLVLVSSQGFLKST